jgi:hypothetical protein
VTRRPWLPDAGIHAFCGFNGSGKTLLAVERLVIPCLLRGFPVVSNVRIDTRVLGLDPADFYVPLVSWRQIPLCGIQEDDPASSITRNRPCVVLLDEATACLPARQYQSTPAELLRTLDQFRKLDAVVGITAPNFHKIEKYLRGCIQLLTTCEGFAPDLWLRDRTRPQRRGIAAMFAPGYPVRRDENGRKMPFDGLWPPNRKFVAADYDASEFEEWSNDRVEKLEPVRQIRYDRRKSIAEQMVNTRQQVNLLDFVQEGFCVHCGKKIKTQFCDGRHAGGNEEDGPKTSRQRRQQILDTVQEESAA